MQGYLHPLYAQSFLEIGEPIFLPNARGWLIKRQIPGTSQFDAMGPYPLFFCEAWEELPRDLDSLREDLVSVSLVIPPQVVFPFDNYQSYFETFFPYKDHYLLDLTLPLNEVISKGRRKDARRALRNIEIEVVTSPNIDLKEWCQIYDNLILKHNIRGVRRFSENSFKSQLSIPGMHFIRAFHNSELVGGSLYLEQGDCVFFHLSAFSEEGYNLDAAYAVKWVALEFFKDKVRWMNLGGSTTKAKGQFSGLDQFKKGWSSETAKSFFCGKIINQVRYNEIIQRKENSNNDWFPAYRAGDY